VLDHTAHYGAAAARRHASDDAGRAARGCHRLAETGHVTQDAGNRLEGAANE
jgi:hypothetical protein